MLLEILNSGDGFRRISLTLVPPEGVILSTDAVLEPPVHLL